MRIVIADDEALLREGLARLLTDAGFEIAGTLRGRRGAAADGRGPAPAGGSGRHPHAAQQAGRRAHRRAGDPPATPRYRRAACCRTISTPAMRCDCWRRCPSASATCSRSACRTSAVLTDALRRLDEGECVIDPTIVSRLVARKRRRGGSTPSASASEMCSRSLPRATPTARSLNASSCRARPSRRTSRRSSSSSTSPSHPSTTGACWRCSRSCAS